MKKIRYANNENIAALLKKKVIENDGYCPCRLAKTPDTKCMCKEFREQEIGVCHCGLYEKYEVEENVVEEPSI